MPVVVTEAPVPERVAPVAVAAPVVAAPVAPSCRRLLRRKGGGQCAALPGGARLNMPLASRRLGEQGPGAAAPHIGYRRPVDLGYRGQSSGFERLDAQA